MLNRRELLRGAALGAAGIGAKMLLPKITEAQEAPIVETDGKARLTSEIENLPDSPIKKQLQERIGFYLNQPSQFTIDESGIPINIYSTRVVDFETDFDTIHADFALRDPKFMPPSHRVAKKTYVYTPLLALTTPDETQKRYGQNTQDGIPIQPISLSQGTNIYEGFAYIINVAHPKYKAIAPNHRGFDEAAVKFAYIKEACSFLLFDILLSETAKKMQDFGLDGYIDVADGGRIEVLSTALSIILNNKGRFTALLDLGGFALAVKAYEGDPNNMIATLADGNPNDPQVATAKNVLSNILLDTSSSLALLESAYKCILDNPALQSIGHQGDYTKLP